MMASPLYSSLCLIRLDPKEGKEYVYQLAIDDINAVIQYYNKAHLPDASCDSSTSCSASCDPYSFCSAILNLAKNSAKFLQSLSAFRLNSDTQSSYQILLFHSSNNPSKSFAAVSLRNCCLHVGPSLQSFMQVSQGAVDLLFLYAVLMSLSLISLHLLHCYSHKSSVLLGGAYAPMKYQRFCHHTEVILITFGPKGWVLYSPHPCDSLYIRATLPILALAFVLLTLYLSAALVYLSLDSFVSVRSLE